MANDVPVRMTEQSWSSRVGVRTEWKCKGAVSYRPRLPVKTLYEMRY